MTPYLPIIALGCLATGSAAVQHSQIRSSVGFIEAKIDGKGPHWFLIDSGANRSALDDDVAKSLGLLRPGLTRVEGTAGVILVNEAAIGQLRSAGLEVRDLKPTVYDLSGSLPPEGQALAGILGVDALRNSAVLFEMEAGRVRLAPTAEELASLAGATIVPFRLDNGIPMIEAAIDGIPVRLRIDTGAAIGDGPTVFVNVTQSVFDQLRRKDPSLVPYTHFTATGAGGEIRIPVIKAKRLSLGGTDVDDPHLSVQPPTGYFARPDAIGFLGAYAFKHWRGFILDYPCSRLILLPKEAGRDPGLRGDLGTGQ